MRRLLYTFFLATLVSSAAQSQPQIAYLLPDIGAPGMNSYVEIIAPVDAIDAFSPQSGSSGEGMIAPSAVSIEMVNPADTHRIIVSPAVVSWDGRLISCQFFVHPQARTGAVPIRVRVNQQLSNIDTFHIVRPQSIGRLSGGGVLGSGGAYGSRSRRGAMIVDSLVLESGRFEIDVTRDPDQNADGNQAFLPAVIISQGPVEIKNGASIVVSARDKNGGPGGGGGGGYGKGSPPIIYGERNVPLGSGFVGARSNLPIFTPPSSSFGVGSGPSGMSLNGVEVKETYSTGPNRLRGLAAGTGHPFDSDGRAGGAAALAADGVSIGSYFGGGGNATVGAGLPPAQSDIYGQPVGNNMIVPVHGGGGGMGGTANDSVGGGGGGGIALYSQLGLSASRLESDGADGANGCNSCGPLSGDASSGGAGGTILVGAKTGSGISTLSVAGGSAGATQPSAPVNSTSSSGGAGRVRIDGVNAGSNPVVTQNATLWTGPTTDTLSVVYDQLFTLKGTGLYDSNTGTRIQVYARGQDSPWNHDAPYIATVRPDGTWQVEVGIATTDSIFYVFAVQLTSPTERSQATEWTDVPKHIFSQAAANIIRFEPAPEMVAPTRVVFDTVICDEHIESDTSISLSNTGLDTLRLSAARFTGPDSDKFEVVDAASVLPLVVAPGKSTTLPIRFLRPGITNGTANASLVVTTNDPALAQGEWTIDLEVRIAIGEYVLPRPGTEPQIDFGNVGVGSAVSRTTALMNDTSVVLVGVVVDEIWIDPPTAGLSIVSRSVPAGTVISPGDSVEFRIEFAPSVTGSLAQVRLCAGIDDPCMDTVCWTLVGEGVESNLEVDKSSLSMSYSGCPEDLPLLDTVTVSNNGSLPATVDTVSVSPQPDYRVVSTTVPPAIQLNPGDQTEIIVEYIPGVAPPPQGLLTIRTNDASDPIELDIQATRDSVQLVPLQDTVHVVTFCTDEPVDTSISLLNSGSLPKSGTVRLTDGSHFSVSGPLNASPGSTISVALQFSGSSSGRITDKLIIETEPCGELDTVVLIGEVLNPTYSIADFSFGGVPVGSTRQGVIVVDNPTGAPLRVVGARIVPPNVGVEIWASQTFPLIIPSNSDSIGVRVSYTPTDLTQIPPGTLIELIIDEPCRDTLTAVIRGFGSDIGLTWAPRPVEMGGLLHCLEDTDTIWVYNTGTSTVQLSTISFDPPGVGFSAEHADPAVPAPTLGPGDSTAVRLTFAPVTDPPGVIVGTMRIATSDQGFGDLEIPVQGVKLIEDVTINSPAFPQTFPGGTSTQQFTLTNSGTATVTLRLLTVSDPFRIVSTSPPLPSSLAPSQSMDIEVEFAPVINGTFNDTIGFETVGGCDSISVPISASSQPSLSVSARWGDVAGEPGDRILIPLELDRDLDGAGVRDVAVDLNYNRSMLLPIDVELSGSVAEGWSIVTTLHDSASYLFELSGQNELGGPGVLAYVRAVVLLGDDTVSTLWSSSRSEFSTGGARLFVDSGEFRLNGYCAVGTSRLVRVENQFGLKSVSPNPSREQFTIEFELVEDGRTNLALYSLDGRPEARLVQKSLSSGAYRVDIDTRLPSGSYLVVLSTPTQRDQRMLVIQR